MREFCVINFGPVREAVTCTNGGLPGFLRNVRIVRGTPPGARPGGCRVAGTCSVPVVRVQPVVRAGTASAARQLGDGFGRDVPEIFEQVEAGL